MGARIRAYDWAATPLGPVVAWSERLKAAVDACLDTALPACVWWGGEFIQIYNDAAAAVMRADHHRVLGRPAHEIWSDVWPEIGPLIESVARTGVPVLGDDLRFEPDRASGPEPAYFTLSFSALREQGGEIAGVLGIAIETTARVSAEAARQRAMDDELRLITDAVPALIAYVDRQQCYRFVNRQYTEWFGRERSEIVGRTMRDVLGPYYDEVRLNVDAALGGTTVRFERLVPRDQLAARHRRSAPRHSEASYIPRLSADGEVEGFYILVVDVTDHKRAEELQQVLIAELQHRTRNLLAIVRSIATQTLRTSRSLSGFGQEFDERISALSRVQGLLSGGTDTISLSEIVVGELAAHGASIDGRRVQVDGPSVRLFPNTVQVLSLALHELATNAVKYGALAHEEARLRVRWTLADSDAAVDFLWVEEGVPLDHAPERQGFGRYLIERVLPYDLDAETSFGFGPDGVRCRIRLSVAAGEAGLGQEPDRN